MDSSTAGLFKRLTFAGVSIVTLAEGDITFLHIGLNGTMNAMYLSELADKTRRGLRRRIENGKAGGGLCYGYRVVRRFENGEVTTGERAIEARHRLKDSDTGKRVARPNPPSAWIVKDVPELRIIDDEMWKAVRDGYASVRRNGLPRPGRIGSGSSADRNTSSRA